MWDCQALLNPRPVLKYPGAKWRLAEWIVSQLPSHQVYLEPFFGSGAVFFHKAPARLETINDINGDVVGLFQVLREQPEQLARTVAFTPWARDEYQASFEKTEDRVEDARRFLVRCWQAHGSRTAGRAGWRHSTSAAGPAMCSQWDALPERIAAAARRLKMAQIENMDAVELIRKYNSPQCLVYADPPYLPETRSGTLYASEMGKKGHLRLLEALAAHPGPVVLSGYDSDLYATALSGWRRVQHSSLAENGRAATEVLWIKDDTGQLTWADLAV